MRLTKNNVIFLFVMIAFLFLANTGCSRKIQESSVIQLTLPSGVGSSKITEFKYEEPMSMQSVSAQDDGDGAEWNPALNPSVLADVNCYMITVSGPESDMQRNTCVTTTGTNLKVGRFAGGIPAGTTLSLEVPSGSKREITVIGFKASAGACTNFKTTDVSGMSLSEPHVLGKIVKDLSPGSQAVSIPVAINGSTLKIDDCAGPDFDFDKAPLYFGDKGPGAGTHTISTNTSYTGLGGVSLQVVNFQTQPAAPNEAYTLIQTPSFPSGFVAGDEVMINVAAQNGGWANDTGSCGYRAWDGRYTFARIAAISSSPVGIYIYKGTFADKLNWNPTLNAFDPTLKSVISSNMGAPPNTTNNFCKLRISKVLHFYDLTINSGVTVVPDMFEYNMGNAGILPIRVAHTLTMEDGALISANATGFMPSSTKNGGGIAGTTTLACTAVPTDTRTGGSCSPDARGAGGGGHGNPIGSADPFVGSGGAGGGGFQTGGQGAGENCGDNSCFGTLTYKIFMGGAGGSSINSLASTGGAGGGMIYLMAKNILVAPGGTVTISNNGADGQSNSSYANYGTGGGGAGGSTLIGFQNFSAIGGATVNIEAYGGDGGMVAGSAINGSGGGGGGAGRVHLIGCNTSETLVTSSVLNPVVTGGFGGLSSTGGVSGSSGLPGSVVKNSVNCL